MSRAQLLLLITIATVITKIHMREKSNLMVVSLSYTTTLAEVSNISSNALVYCLLVHKVSDYIGLNMLLSWMVVVITLTQNRSRTVARTIL